MSIRTMAQVWERSQHKGTNLLILLAIADFSDDDGQAFPAVSKLATKCRMTKRNAQDRLNELSASGELTVLKNQGPPPKYPNLFRINLSALGMKPTAPVKPTALVQFDVSRGEVHCTPGVKPTAPKPSYKRQELSDGNSACSQAGFDEFWCAYPKKKAKDAAMKAFAKRKPGRDLLDQMLAAIDTHKRTEDWLKENGKFIPYPATWLNHGRWTDEIDADPGSSSSMFAGGI